MGIQPFAERWDASSDKMEKGNLKAQPDARLSELPLPGKAESHRLLVEWNATAGDYPSDVCLHGLIEAQAAKTPEAVALFYEGQEVTYRQLNARANRLACHLRKLGVGSEAIVGVFTERSIEMVVGFLAVLKARGAHLPLEPAYPAAS